MELPAHNNETALLDSAVPGQSQNETIVSAPETRENKCASQTRIHERLQVGDLPRCDQMDQRTSL